MESPPIVLHLLFGLLITFGLAACFFGYRIYRFILAAPGWVAGAALLGSLTYLVADNWLLAIIAGFIGGSIGAWVVLTWWVVENFRVGFGFGLLLDVALWLVTDGQVEPVVLIAIPIIAGIMAHKLKRWTLIVITAFAGAAFALIGGVWFAVGADDLGVFLAADGGPLKALLAGWLLLAVVGVNAQYAALRGPRQREEAAPDVGAGVGAPAGRAVATAVPATPQPAAPRIRPQALTGHAGPIKAVVWDPRDRWIATAGQDGVVRLWDPRSGAPLLHLRGHPHAIATLAAAPDGSWLAASGGGKVLIWDTAAGVLRKALDGAFKSAMVVHPQGDWLAVISDDSSVHLYEPRNWGRVRRLPPVGWWQFRDIDLLALDRTGQWLATAGDENLNLWDTRTGRLRLHRGYFSFFSAVGDVCRLLMQPDGRCLIHSCRDLDEIQVTYADGTVESIPPLNSWVRLTISPTGRWIAAWHRYLSKGLCVLDFKSSEVRQRTQSSYGCDGYHLLFSADETWLAATWQKAIDVLSPATGDLLCRLAGHEKWINAIAASPDSRALASADDLGELRVWDIASGQLKYRQSPIDYSARVLTVSVDGETLFIGTDDGRVRA